MNTIKKDLDWCAVPVSGGSQLTVVEAIPSQISQVTSQVSSMNDDFLNALNISDEEWESTSAGGFFIY